MNLNQTINVACERGDVVKIGVHGTFNVRSVSFDFSAWQAAYGAGEVTVHAQRPNETLETGTPLIYEPNGLNVDGAVLTWTFDAVDTGIVGYGACSVVYTVDGEKKAETAPYRTYIEKSLDKGASVSPTPIIGNYNDLSNKPQINGVTLAGNKTGAELGLDRTYIHKQSAAAAEWTITHDLEKYPSVAVVDSIGRIVGADVRYRDANTVVLTFNAAVMGTAYLN